MLHIKSKVMKSRIQWCKKKKKKFFWGVGGGGGGGWGVVWGMKGGGDMSGDHQRSKSRILVPLFF